MSLAIMGKVSTSRKMLKKYLERGGMNSHGVESGQAAVGQVHDVHVERAHPQVLHGPAQVASEPRLPVVIEHLAGAPEAKVSQDRP